MPDNTAQNETIYALATPQGRSGVAVIRVSGPHALHSLAAFCPSLKLDKLKPRMAYLTELYAPGQNVSRETLSSAKTDETSPQMLDKALIIYFKAPNSFTGEDVVEYHLHGSPAVISEVSSYLSGFINHRPAERGEFTRRGFENGRMDLTEAEAIADLIDAETSAQKDQALSQMSGSLKTLYEGWAEELTRSLAYLEADLDFPDEDLPDGVAAQVRPKLEKIRDEISAHLNDNRRGERLRDGIKIAVIGAPNAGKSTLVNALAQRDVAITSDFAGTTRDVLDVYLDLGGYPVILSDTAGLKPELLHDVSRETFSSAKTDEAFSAHDQIESEGIKRALKVAQNADLKLLVFDASQPLDEATLSLRGDNSLVVLNKFDLGSQTMEKAISVSLAAGEGLMVLLETITEKIKTQIGQSAGPTLTRERHRHQLQDCLTHIERALTAELPELVAEDTRLAVRNLGRITGRVDVEDLLDLIFSEFCIGK